VVFPGKRPKGLADSKTLSEALREALFGEIMKAAQVGVGEASAQEIDQLNIRQATHLAMRRALAALPMRPVAALVDGNDAPPLGVAVEAIVDGDAHVPLIAAASIIAKVTRDRFMREMAKAHPGYGFESHKGYGAPAHAEALNRLGPSPLHRLTFKPVAEAAAARAARGGL
jgi:ribonuclease HII